MTQHAQSKSVVFSRCHWFLRVIPGRFGKYLFCRPANFGPARVRAFSPRREPDPSSQPFWEKKNWGGGGSAASFFVKGGHCWYLEFLKFREKKKRRVA